MHLSTTARARSFARIPYLIPRRARAWLALVAACLPAGCGATMWPSFTGTGSSSASETFACSVEKAKSMGYATGAIDEKDRRLNARKQVKPRHQDYDELRRIDELRIQVPRVMGGGSGPELRIQAVTYSMRATRRGPTQYDHVASDQVRADARALLDACGGGTGTTSISPAR